MKKTLLTILLTCTGLTVYAPYKASDTSPAGILKAEIITKKKQQEFKEQEKKKSDLAIKKKQDAFKLRICKRLLSQSKK